MSTFFSESLLNSKLVNDFNQDSDQELHQQWQKNVDAVHNHHNKARKKQSPFLRALHRRISGHMRRLCSHQRQEEDRRAEEYRTRRMWGSDGRLPSEIRYNFTEGQRAILRVIAEQVKKCARCTLSVRHIAGMAGIKSRLVQYTLRRAQGLGLIRVDERRQQGNRNLTNIVWIICEDWLDWIGLGKKCRKPKGGGVHGCA